MPTFHWLEAHRLNTSLSQNISTFVSLETKWLTSKCVSHVFDLAKVLEIMPSSHPALIKFHQQVVAQDKSLYSINAPAFLLPKIKAGPLSQVLNPVDNIAVIHKVNEARKSKREDVPASDSIAPIKREKERETDTRHGERGGRDRQLEDIFT